MPAAAQPPIEPGRQVRIAGLKNRSDLNGLIGTILAPEEGGRVAVKVHKQPNEEDTEFINIKPENFEVLWDTPTQPVEEAICPLCRVTVMDTSQGPERNAGLQTCCGKAFCRACLKKSMAGPNPDLCPFCGADTSDTSSEKTLADLKRLAKQGNAVGQYQLAYRYDFGDMGVPQNKQEARRLYKAAADQGSHTKAAYNLACCYRNGEGGPVDGPAAVRYFLKAASAGHIQAMTNLGCMYMNGTSGVDRDLDEAVKWLQQGADAGDELAVKELQKAKLMLHMTSLGVGVAVRPPPF